MQLASKGKNPKDRAPFCKGALSLKLEIRVLFEAYLLRYLLHVIIRIAVGVVCRFTTTGIVTCPRKVVQVNC
jgi:hypothetical protein